MGTVEGGNKPIGGEDEGCDSDNNNDDKVMIYSIWNDRTSKKTQLITTQLKIEPNFENNMNLNYIYKNIKISFLRCFCK